MQKMSAASTLQDIARAEIARLDPGWEALTIVSKSLYAISEEMTHVRWAQGDVESRFVDLSVPRLFRKLREESYVPNAGTWFTASVTVENDGSVDAQFDYDNEPEWEVSVKDGLYVNDFEKYPRSEERTPGWLAEKIKPFADNLHGRV